MSTSPSEPRSQSASGRRADMVDAERNESRASFEISGVFGSRCGQACPRAAGFTLVEILIALGLGSLVITTVVLLYLFGLRSFTAIGNYTEMDVQSRMAMDTMLKEMRQASGVVAYNTNLPTRWLLLTNG